MNKINLTTLVENAKMFNILYAEDDMFLREKNAVLLERIFKKVDAYEDGLVALEQYKNAISLNRPYDIVITDISMPKMSGLELSKNILNINSHQPILVMSAYNDSDKLETLISLGIQHYIKKPASLEQTIDALTKIVASVQHTESVKNIDHATQLQNINALHSHIKHAVNKNLLIISLKNYNDLQTVYGIEHADSLLTHFASELNNFLHSNEHLYRKGASKFAYLFDKSIDADMLRRDIVAFSKQFEFDIILGISCEEDNLLATANMALDFASKHGLQYKIYSKYIDMTDKYKNELLFKSILTEALDKGNVFPVFQPIFNKDKEIVKYEVLMRVKNLRDGKEQTYYPCQFLDIAIKTNHFYKMSFSVIEKAFSILEHSDKQFSINLSYEDIVNNILTDKIEELLKQYPTVQNRLVIEILETEHVDNNTVIEQLLNRFKKYGIKIALDDFGAGYSNLNNIINFHCDYVKLDGELIKNIQSDKKSLAIVKSVITFTKELNIKTIAEYVATKEIFDLVKDIGVDEFQGFYLSKPLEVI